MREATERVARSAKVLIAHVQESEEIDDDVALVRNWVQEAASRAGKDPYGSAAWCATIRAFAESLPGEHATVIEAGELELRLAPYRRTEVRAELIECYEERIAASRGEEREAYAAAVLPLLEASADAAILAGDNKVAAEHYRRALVMGSVVRPVDTREVLAKSKATEPVDTLRASADSLSKRLAADPSDLELGERLFRMRLEIGGPSGVGDAVLLADAESIRMLALTDAPLTKATAGDAFALGQWYATLAGNAWTPAGKSQLQRLALDQYVRVLCLDDATMPQRTKAEAEVTELRQQLRITKPSRSIELAAAYAGDRVRRRTEQAAKDAAPPKPPAAAPPPAPADPNADLRDQVVRLNDSVFILPLLLERGDDWREAPGKTLVSTEDKPSRLEWVVDATNSIVYRVSTIADWDPRRGAVGFGFEIDGRPLAVMVAGGKVTLLNVAGKPRTIQLREPPQAGKTIRLWLEVRTSIHASTVSMIVGSEEVRLWSGRAEGLTPFERKDRAIGKFAKISLLATGKDTTFSRPYVQVTHGSLSINPTPDGARGGAAPADRSIDLRRGLLGEHLREVANRQADWGTNNNWIRMTADSGLVGVRMETPANTLYELRAQTKVSDPRQFPGLNFVVRDVPMELSIRHNQIHLSSVRGQTTTTDMQDRLELDKTTSLRLTVGYRDDHGRIELAIDGQKPFMLWEGNPDELTGTRDDPAPEHRIVGVSARGRGIEFANISVFTTDRDIVAYPLGPDQP